MTRAPIERGRALLAVAAAVAIGVCYALAALVLPRFAAIGIFTAEDWLALAPDFYGRLIDFILGLGVAIGFWAIAHALRFSGLITAIAIGGAAFLLAPQISAVNYVWRTFGYVDWGVAINSLARAWPHFLLGAVVGAVMWRIAYRQA